MRRVFLFFLIAQSTLSTFGQSNISFDRLTTKEGLSHDQVRAIVQDSNGFIWFGTTSGLQRFDGKKFVTYKNIPGDSNSLIGDRIRTLLADDEGGIWIGTFGSGLSYLKNGKFTHYTYQENNPNSISNNSIEALVKDKKGNLWIGTREGGLNKFKDGIFTRYKSDEDNPSSLSYNGVFSLLVDSKDRLWVGTYGGGLNLFQDEKFIRLNQENSLTNQTVHGDFIISIYEDSKEAIWVGTWQEGYSILSFNNDEMSIKNFRQGTNGPNNSSFLTTIEHEGKMVLGTWGGGLNVISNDTFQFHRSVPGDNASLSSDYIESLLVDDEGYLWIGTYGGGACRLNISSFVTFRNNPQTNSLNNNFVTDLIEHTDGSIWASTLGGGVNRYDGESFKFYKYKEPDSQGYGDPTNTAWSLIEASDGSIWVAGQTGLDHYKNGKFKHYEFKDNKDVLSSILVYSVIEGLDGEIIFGTWEGRIMQLKGGNTTVIYDVAEREMTESNHPAHSILQQEDGAIWACLESVGLLRIENGEISKIFFEWSPEKTNVPVARDVIKSKFENALWAGTSLGLYKINLENDSLTFYNTEVGLVSDNIISIVEDNKGIIWVATMNGISRLDPVSNEFANFDESDGLQGNQFVRSSKYLSPASGKIYLGGTNGFNVFHPDSISITKNDPKVAITGLQVLYKEVSPLNSQVIDKSIENEKEIILSHRDKIFGFDFSTINYDRLFKQYQYAYYLENYEEDWNYVGTRTYASYNNIPPGEYLFKVKSSETGSNWQTPVTSIKVVIHPPWYYTLWAKLLAVALIISLIITIFRIRIKSIEERNQILKKLVEKRTEELSDSNDKLQQLNNYKEQMTSMVVHDLKNPLNTIFGMGEKKEVVEAANQMLNLVNNMLEIHKFEETSMNLQIENLSLNDIIDASIQQVKLQADRKAITFIIEVEEGAIVRADEEILIRVVVNLLTNAIKFSPTNSDIKLTTHDLPESWQLSIQDFGPGIPEDAQNEIFVPYSQLEAREFGITPSTGLGLTFCNYAIKAHNGFLGVKSKIEEGATFFFTLEKSNDELVIKKEASVVTISPGISLSEHDKEYLQQYVARLQNIEIYEFSKLSKVIDEIDNRSDSVIEWKQSFKNAIYTSNSLKFHELINLA